MDRFPFKTQSGFNHSYKITLSGILPARQLGNVLIWKVVGNWQNGGLNLGLTGGAENY